MPRWRILVVACATVFPIAAQPNDPTWIANLKSAHALEAPGTIPTFYEAATKERALRAQKSMESAADWYEKQLGVRVPMVLMVVTSATRKKVIGDDDTLPRNLGTTPAIIVFPEVKPSAQAIEGADDDHKPGGLLQNEWVLFHEYAHLLAAFRLNILSGNYWINELVAGIFTTSYIAQSRTDLAFVLQARRENSPPARYRYTSLADLNYLGAVGMDPQNYGNWFQFHLERLADFLTQDQPLPAVVAKLQTDFPEDDIKFETPDELIKKLSRIRPGLLDAVAGPLAGPLTLAANTPVACTDASPDRTRTTSVSIHNRRSEPIVVTFSGGTTRTIQPQTNATLYNVYPGAPIKLSDGRCIVPRAEPTVTYIDK